MKIAFIDIGTNTVLLLLVEINAEGVWKTLAEGCHIARLGEGLVKHSRFLNTAQERVLLALQDFKNTCEHYGCDEYNVVGTAAFRKAQNGAEFANTILKKLNLSVRIISGEEEARLISLATSMDFDAYPKPLLTLDIGGGSTEFIVNHLSHQRELFSLPFGAVRLYEDFFQESDCPSEKQITDLRVYLQQNIVPLKESLTEQPQTMVATAGTPTTAQALLMKLQTYDATLVHKSVLQISDLENLFNDLLKIPLDVRQNIPCLPKGRADVILAGLLILLEVMKAFDFKKTYVSDYGLRHGLLFDYLQRN